MTVIIYAINVLRLCTLGKKLQIILANKVCVYKFAFSVRQIMPMLVIFIFNSIGDIIDHYRKEQIVEGYYLKEPVPMQVSVVFLSVAFYFEMHFWWYVYAHIHAFKTR